MFIYFSMSENLINLLSLCRLVAINGLQCYRILKLYRREENYAPKSKSFFFISHQMRKAIVSKEITICQLQDQT